MCASREYIRERNWLAEQLFRSHAKHSRCLNREHADLLTLETQEPKVKYEWHLIAQDAMELRAEYKRRLNARRHGLDVDTADVCLEQIRQIKRKALEERDRQHLESQQPIGPFLTQV